MVVQICPKCGGELNITNASGKVFCYHCGAEVSGLLETNREDDEEKLLSVAKSFEDAGDYKEAIENYNKVISKNTKNWHAWLGKGRCVIFDSTLANPLLRESCKFFLTAYEIAPHESKEQVSVEIKINTLSYISTFFSSSESLYDRSSHETESSHLEHIVMLVDIIDAVTSLPCHNPELYDVPLFELGISFFRLDIIPLSKLGSVMDKKQEYLHKINVIKPDYTPPKQGCFIATATMGYYDHPDVITLREFRDHFLMKSSAGKRFISFYYKNSPQFAHRIENSEGLKTLVRVLLIKPLVLLVKPLIK